MIGWQPPANIGLLPQHAGDGTDPFFTIGWTPKQSATYYPYDPAELNVAPGVPDPPTPVPAPLPSPVLRAHVARLSLLARKNPVLFRKHGLRFAIELQAPAVVTAVLVVGKRKLTYTQQRSLRAGTAHFALHPSQYGRATARRTKRTAARLEVSIRYTDGSRGTLTRSVLLARK